MMISLGEIAALREAARTAWSNDTRQAYWKNAPISRGQSFVTASWLQKKLGGDVALIDGHFVWANNKFVLDLTRDQCTENFDGSLRIYNQKIASSAQKRVDLFAQRADEVFENLAENEDFRLIKRALDYMGDAFPGEEPQQRTYQEHYWDDNPSFQGQNLRFLYAQGKLQISDQENYLDLGEELGVDAEYSGPMALGKIEVGTGNTASVDVIQSNVEPGLLIKELKTGLKNFGWDLYEARDPGGNSLNTASESQILSFAIQDDEVYISPNSYFLARELFGNKVINKTALKNFLGGQIYPHANSLACDIRVASSRPISLIQAEKEVLFNGLSEWARDRARVLVANDNVIKRVEDLSTDNIYAPVNNDEKNRLFFPSSTDDKPDFDLEETKNNIHTCPECNQLFPNWYTLQKHRKKDEALGQEPEYEGGFPELNFDVANPPHYTEQAPRVDTITMGSLKQAKFFPFEVEDGERNIVGFWEGDPIGYATFDGNHLTKFQCVDVDGILPKKFLEQILISNKVPITAHIEPKYASVYEEYGINDGKIWRLSANKHPKDMIRDPIPFIYDIEEDGIYVGEPGSRTSQIPGKFSPGGIVEGTYEPGGKVFVKSQTNMPWSVRHVLDLWMWQHPEMTITAISMRDDEGKEVKLAMTNKVRQRVLFDAAYKTVMEMVPEGISDAESLMANLISGVYSNREWTGGRPQPSELSNALGLAIEVYRQEGREEGQELDFIQDAWGYNQSLQDPDQLGGWTLAPKGIEKVKGWGGDPYPNVSGDPRIEGIRWRMNKTLSSDSNWEIIEAQFELDTDPDYRIKSMDQRRPFLANITQRKIFIGPPGAYHVDLERWLENNQVPPDRGPAGYINLWDKTVGTFPYDHDEDDFTTDEEENEIAQAVASYLGPDFSSDEWVLSKVASKVPQVIESKLGDEETVYSDERRDWLWRRAFIYDPEGDIVWISRPGHHHTDIQREFGDSARADLGWIVSDPSYMPYGPIDMFQDRDPDPDVLRAIWQAVYPNVEIPSGNDDWVISKVARLPTDILDRFTEALPRDLNVSFDVGDGDSLGWDFSNWAMVYVPEKHQLLVGKEGGEHGDIFNAEPWLEDYEAELNYGRLDESGLDWYGTPPDWYWPMDFKSSPDEWKIQSSKENWADFHAEFRLPKATANLLKDWVDSLDWAKGAKKESVDNYHITILSVDNPDDKAYRNMLGEWRDEINNCSFKSTELDLFGDDCVVLKLSSDDWKELSKKFVEKAEEYGLEPRKFQGGARAHITLGFSTELPKIPDDVDMIGLEFSTAKFNVNKNAAIADNYDDLEPDLSEVPEGVNIIYVGGKQVINDAHDFETWPVIFSAKTNTLYVGPFGAYHWDMLADKENAELQEGFPEYPEDGTAPSEHSGAEWSLGRAVSTDPEYGSGITWYKGNPGWGQPNPWMIESANEVKIQEVETGDGDFDGWRRPLVYDLTTSTVYVGEPSALHNQMIEPLRELGVDLGDFGDAYEQHSDPRFVYGYLADERYSGTPEARFWDRPVPTSVRDQVVNHFHPDHPKTITERFDEWQVESNYPPSSQEQWDSWDKYYGPENTDPMQLENFVEWIDPWDLHRYREYDRDMDKPYVEDLKEHIRQHGMGEPIKLEYNQDDGSVHIGEGNHRLQIALDLGLKAVPVTVFRTGRVPQGRPAKPAPKTYPPDEFGYVPGNMKPSDIGFTPVSPSQKQAATEIDTSFVYEDQTAVAAIEALQKAQGNVFVVGGAVRDVLRGAEPKDIDLMVTNLKPESVRVALEGLPGRVDVTGKDFGVFRYRDGAGEVEIALPRKEKSTGESHKDFDISADPNMEPEEDLFRRDFTINAMAIDLQNGQLIDPHGGSADIEQGILRSHNPQSISEDPLRILRGIVAAARFGVEPDEETKHIMRSNAQSLKNISAERVQMELDKLFAADNPDVGIELAHETGVLGYILPEVENAFGFDQANKHHERELGDHLLEVLKRAAKLTDDPDLRLAALLHDIGKPDSQWFDEEGWAHYYENEKGEGADHEIVGAKLAEQRLEALKYPRERIDRVRNLINHHMFPAYTTDKGARRFLNKVGDHADDLFILREADQGGKKYQNDPQEELPDLEQQKSLLQKVREQGAPVQTSQLAINGNDLIQIGVQPGPAMGQLLEVLTQAVIDDPSLNERETLLELAQNA